MLHLSLLKAEHLGWSSLADLHILKQLVPRP
jgi:hypothetical protein